MYILWGTLQVHKHLATKNYVYLCILWFYSEVFIYLIIGCFAGHHIGERAHMIEREQNYYTGDAEENQEFINLEEDEAEEFDRYLVYTWKFVYNNLIYLLQRNSASLFASAEYKDFLDSYISN